MRENFDNLTLRGLETGADMRPARQLVSLNGVRYAFAWPSIARTSSDHLGGKRKEEIWAGKERRRKRKGVTITFLLVRSVVPLCLLRYLSGI
jgi:hypothetical protein